MQKTIFRATALSLLMTAAGFAFAASGALPVEKLAADVVVPTFWLIEKIFLCYR